MATTHDEIMQSARVIAQNSSDPKDILAYEQIRATLAVATALDRLNDTLVGYDESGFGVNVKNRT